MKHTIVHLSDTHLGYSELDRVSPEGVNQRERDFYGSFEEIVNRIIALRPAAVVHTGDFFHRPSPANRPLIEGLRHLKRLSDVNIPVVVIAGNHSTPRTLYTSPILTAFRSVDGVYPSFRQKYETVEAGYFVFHGLPHIADERLYAEELEKVEPVEGRINVLMLHASVGRDYIMEEYGERVFPSDRTAVINEFQYTALGHWHNFQQVGKKYPRAWYSGSTERLSDREAGSEKGYCVVRFDNPKEVKVDFQPVPVRPWRRYDIKDCDGMEAAGIAADDAPAVAGQDENTCAFVRFGGADLPFPVAGMSDVMPYESICFKDLNREEIKRYEACFRKRLEEAVQRFRPDLIHSHHLWLMTSAARQAFPGIPMAATCHGTDLRQFQNCPHLRERVLNGCRRLDAVMALSRRQKNEIAELYAIAPETIYTTGVGYNAQLFSFDGEKAPDGVRLVYAGKLSRAKGVPWMLRALATLTALPWTLDLVGGGSGPEKAECLRMARDLGQRVVIHGPVPQEKLAEILRQGHLFILPSFFEGIPIVLLEAMACGCRVVTTALPGVDELFEALPETWFSTVALPRLQHVDRPVAEDEAVFERCLGKAVAEKIRQIQSSPDTDFEGRSDLLKPHTWHAVYNRVEAVYRKIVG